jgi:hypothetical protein
VFVKSSFMGNTQVKGKVIQVNAPAHALYSIFADMNNLVKNLPEDKKKGVKTTEDTIEGTFQGFSMGLKIVERLPFSSVSYEQFGNSPFQFKLVLFFDAVDVAVTDFHLELDAELNFMLKTIIGGKIQELVDKITEGLSMSFEGKMPPDVDPEEISKMYS